MSFSGACADSLFLWRSYCGSFRRARACARAGVSCHSFSMSLYFFLRMETWSLNSTGSSLIRECSSGMKPSQRLKTFMQVCRWAKWSGSAHRDTLELWVGKNRQGENRFRVIRSFHPRQHCPVLKDSRLSAAARDVLVGKLVKRGLI